MELRMSGSECSRNLPLDRGTRVMLELGQPSLIGGDGFSWSVLHRGDVAEQFARPRDVLAPTCCTGELEGRLRTPVGFRWIAFRQPVLGKRRMETNRIDPAEPLIVGERRFGRREMVTRTI